MSGYKDRLADRGESVRVDTPYRGMSGQPVRMAFYDQHGRKVHSAAQARPAIVTPECKALMEKVARMMGRKS